MVEGWEVQEVQLEVGEGRAVPPQLPRSVLASARTLSALSV